MGGLLLAGLMSIVVTPASSSLPFHCGTKHLGIAADPGYVAALYAQYITQFTFNELHARPFTLPTGNGGSEVNVYVVACRQF